LTSPSARETVRVIDSALPSPDLPIVEGTGKAWAVLWPGNGAVTRTFQVIDLDAGDKTVALKHPSDAVYYLAVGAASVVDTVTGQSQALREGAMVHIDAGDGYRLVNAGADVCRIIGGPCPPDPALYAHLQNAKA
jgi:mannose-6-phosphate isomerase-like protein (cupin superfamily)